MFSMIQSMEDGVKISVIKILHMMVCTERVSIDTKPGGTAGRLFDLSQQKNLSGTGFLRVTTSQVCNIMLA